MIERQWQSLSAMISPSEEIQLIYQIINIIKTSLSDLLEYIQITLPHVSRYFQFPFLCRRPIFLKSIFIIEQLAVVSLKYPHVLKQLHKD